MMKKSGYLEEFESRDGMRSGQLHSVAMDLTLMQYMIAHTPEEVQEALSGAGFSQIRIVENDYSRRAEDGSVEKLGPNLMRGVAYRFD